MSEIILNENDYEITRSDPLFVMATNCLFFAWAPHDYQGPKNWSEGGWESGDAYRPALKVVDGFEVVQLQVGTPDLIWAHGKGSNMRSKADGRTDASMLTKQEYKHADYSSLHIDQEDVIPLNALVVMFGQDPHTPPDSTWVAKIEYVGSGDTFTIPAGATHMYLGMHDGYEWSNNFNVGDVPMRVDATLGKRRKP